MLNRDNFSFFRGLGFALLLDAAIVAGLLIYLYCGR